MLCSFIFTLLCKYVVLLCLMRGLRWNKRVKRFKWGKKVYILKGTRNAYFNFQYAGLIMRRNFVLISAIYTHLYGQLNSSTNFFNFCWWRIPFAMTQLLRIGVTDYAWRKPKRENKPLSKKMDHWIIFRLKVVSLITNNDNPWSKSPIWNRFRWHESKILFLRLND